MTKPDLQELYNEHIKYECEMLVCTDQMLRLIPVPYPVGNALIESFCFHARCLIEFFDSKYLTTSLFVDSSYKPWTSGRVPTLLAKKLNTQVAHLTAHRVADSNKKIGVEDRAKLLSCISQEVDHFCSHLKPQFDPNVLIRAISIKLIVLTPTTPSTTNAIQIS